MAFNPNQLGERATENQSLLNEIGEADLKQWQCHARALELTALDTLSDARMLNLMHTWLKSTKPHHYQDGTARAGSPD